MIEGSDGYGSWKVVIDIWCLLSLVDSFVVLNLIVIDLWSGCRRFGRGLGLCCP